MDPITSVRRHGGVASLAELRKDGVADYARITALRAGDIYRVRNGWFSLPTAAPDLVRASRIGGRLSCTSLLKSKELWMMPDDRLHVTVAENAARLRSPDDRRIPWNPHDPNVVVHWNHFDWAPPRHAATDTIAAAIGQLILCAPRVHALVAIDSALNKNLLSRAELRGVLAHLPARYSNIGDHADSRAQSGLETLARLRLSSRRVRVRIQVPIPGVGRVDTLVGDRVILELDSRAHHLGTNYEKDRSRDLTAVEHGYIVLRVSYHRVLHDWASIERVVMALVRRREHEWNGMHRRLGLAGATPRLSQNSG